MAAVVHVLRAALAFSLAGAFSSPAASEAATQLRGKGLRPASSTEAELDAALQTRRVAVLVGIDAYDDPALPDLEFAASDARSLADTLRSPALGGFDRVFVLDDPKAESRSDLLAQLRGIGTDLKKQDVFVLYWSGHGLARFVAADKGEIEARLYLLARDSRATDLEGSAVAVAGLRDWFAGLPALRKAFLVDACFNGDGKSGPQAGKPPPDAAERIARAQAPSLTELGPGEAHLFATTPGRAAYEDPVLGHGVYTAYLLQALDSQRGAADSDGDGVVTAWEAHDWARGRVHEHTQGAQVPEASLRVVGKNDVVLSGEDRARRARDRGLVYDYGAAGQQFAGAQLWVDGRRAASSRRRCRWSPASTQSRYGTQVGPC